MCADQRRHYVLYVADWCCLLGKETVPTNKNIAIKLASKLKNPTCIILLPLRVNTVG